MTQNPGGIAAQSQDDRPPSLIAAHIGRMTLRMGHYPGRTIFGTFLRKRARQRGGRSFYAYAQDGTRLAGWFSPARADAPSRLPIVMSHGWCEIKEVHFHQAWRFNALGHDVVLFDHRSHGRSKGQYVTFGVRERHDLTAVVNEAMKRGLIPERFITVGFSLGAATVLQHAATDPRVAGVVAFAPFVSFREAILSFRDWLAPWMTNDAWLLRGFEQATRNHGFALEDACTLDAIGRLEAPVLLVEAGRDRNLPPSHHTQKLIPAKTRGSIQVITVPTASHRTLCRQPWPGLSEQVAAFCAELT